MHSEGVRAAVRTLQGTILLNGVASAKHAVKVDGVLVTVQNR